MTDVTSATKSLATSGPQRLRPLATSKTRKKKQKTEASNLNFFSAWPNVSQKYCFAVTTTA